MKVIRLAWVLLCLNGLSTVAVAQEDVAALLTKAQEAQRSQNFDTAIDGYERALKTDLSTATKTVVLINLGAAYKSKRQWDKAIELFKQAQKLQPEQPASWYFMGEALFASNRLDESLAAYNQALKMLPKEAAFWSGRASLHLKMGNEKLALEDCDEAVRLDPKNSAHYDKRGAVHYAGGNLPAAERDYTESIRLDPANVSPYNNRGVLYKHSQQWDKAIADLTMALKLAPEHDSAWSNRAQVYRDMGEWGKALVDFKQAVKLHPDDDESWFGLALLYGACPDECIRDGRLGIEAATKACELKDWKSNKCLDALGMAHAEAGEFEKAVQAADKALVLPVVSRGVKAAIQKRRAQYLRKEAFRNVIPTWGSVAAAVTTGTAEGWMAAGHTALLQKDYDKAFDHFSKALTLNPSQEDRAIALGSQALVYTRKGLWDLAIETSSEAIRLQPDEETLYQTRAKALQGKGEMERAVADLGEVMRITPDDGKVQCERGRLYQKLGKPDLAEADFTAVIKRSPKSVDALSMRALLYLNRGRWKECLQDGDRLLELKPEMAEVWSMQALVLGMAPDPAVRDGKRAVEKGNRACELSQWKDWQYLSHLAAAHAEDRNFEEADKVLQRALSLPGVPQSGTTQLQNMRRQYSAGKPLYMKARE